MPEDPAEARPAVVDRVTFEHELEVLRAREKAHIREGDSIAAARRRLPMVDVGSDGVTELRLGADRDSPPSVRH